MKITVHTLAGDDDNGTWSTAFATDEAWRAGLLEAVGETPETFAEWIAEKPDERDEDDSLWDFVSARSGDLDTYGGEEESIDFDLCAQPLPATGREQVDEAIECLKRACYLLTAADNKRTLARVRSALSSAKGAARIQASRAVRADAASWSQRQQQRKAAGHVDFAPAEQENV